MDNRPQNTKVTVMVYCVMELVIVNYADLAPKALLFLPINVDFVAVKRVDSISDLVHSKHLNGNVKRVYVNSLHNNIREVALVV